MEMILRHSTKAQQNQSHSDIYSSLMESFISDMRSDNKLQSPTSSGKYVLLPDLLQCFTCYIYHGHPSHELTEKESEEFLQLLEHCPCFCASIQCTRHYVAIYDDFLNRYVESLDRKFNSLEELITHNKKFQERSWKLVTENETRKQNFTAGPVVKKLLEMPEGILEECKDWFPRVIDFLYVNRTGFIKGKYLVISTELLFRYCEGDVNQFMNHLSQAYSLVESRYCSVSRMPIEAGFWQVCPEFEGFFRKNIDFRINFPFLKEFMKEKMIFIRNFSLSMGPHYLIGGGYFSYIYNNNQDLVVWYLPNFWNSNNFGFNLDKRAFMDNFRHFWGGIESSEYGCSYRQKRAIQEACDCNMLQFLEDYY